jgi:tetraacyldisaccharide 4'-kinase
MPGRSTLANALERQWWLPRPGLAMRALLPLAWLFRGLATVHRLWARSQRTRPVPGTPVLVVGNLVVGGAGKTPTVMALIEWLRNEGWQPGVVSRGHGREGDGIVDVSADMRVEQTGDEPLLIHLRTGAPVVVGRDRVAAARALCVRHPGVDFIVSDDGLQHHRLARDVELVVFDGRGAGNGLTLPAGPLRQALPRQLPPQMVVLYNAERPSTQLPGEVARRALAGAVPLDAWWQGQHAARRPLSELRDRPVLAAAGTGDPERFFRMLEQAGLRIERLALPDHARYEPLPWPVTTVDVVVTEKDAVKLRPGAVGATRVWVVALDFALPAACTQALRQRLPAPPASPSSSTLATPP